VPEEFSNGELKQLDLLERIAKRSLKNKVISQRDHWEKGNNDKLSDNELIYKAKYRNKINLDIGARCPLECLRCRRQDYAMAGMKPPGHDISLEDFDKILMHFTNILFCGQISDPTAHSKFHDILRRCNEENAYVCVATAASHRSEKWYREAFELNKNAVWRFGIDGFPEESMLYRINQDGEKLWRMALIAKDMGLQVEQQCIVFSYNEDHIDEVQKHATDAGIRFIKLYSSRWRGGDEDSLRPKKRENYVSSKPFTTTEVNNREKDVGDKKLWNEEQWLQRSSLCQ
jgi:MoaA/NifB/PqqE/SkfB family radical SAM enzyme